jgi:hypothetical protein
MSRNPKLAAWQEAEIVSRLNAGEKAADLSREYGVSQALMSTKFGKKKNTARALAEHMLLVEQEFKSHPYDVQVAAQEMLNDLRAISAHLAGAARLGAATARTLHAMAHRQAGKIDPDKPMEGDAMRSIAALSRTANDAGAIGLHLLGANRELMQAAPVSKEIAFTWADAAAP